MLFGISVLHISSKRKYSYHLLVKYNKKTQKMYVFFIHAFNLILSLYESDIRMVNFPDSKVMLIRLYSKYGKRILKVVKQCMKSADKELMELGGHAVCDFYIRYHEFEDIISDVGMKSKEQLRAILHRAVMYLIIDKYRELAKEIILEYRKFDIDEGCPLSLIFKSENIDAERDKEFLQELMKSNAGRRTTYAFTHFLEKVQFLLLIMQISLLHYVKMCCRWKKIN